MNYFQRYLAEEFAEDYSEGRISRRKALKLIISVTGSALIANTILAACAPSAETPPGSVPSAIPVTGTEDSAAAATITPPAGTATAVPSTHATATSPAAGGTTTNPSGERMNVTVRPDDPAVVAGEVQFTGQDGASLSAYLARPAAGDPVPVVLVCHENRGLTDHIRDVTRRLTKAGYVALAVDLLSRQGGTASVGSDSVPGVLGNTNPDQFVQDFLSGWEYLKDQPFADAQRVGMVGFCFGGGVTWRVATKMPELLAAVPYYGPPPPIEELVSIQAAVLAIYGERDERINATIPAVEEEMARNNNIFEKEIYQGADHAFNNDTSPRYNQQAANSAWNRTLDWFDQYLKS